MMNEAPNWVKEVAVQGDWVSDNPTWKSKMLGIWNVPSLLLTGSKANNKGAIGERYLVPAPSTQQLTDYAQRKWPEDVEDNPRWVREFDPHNQVEDCLRIYAGT